MPIGQPVADARDLLVLASEELRGPLTSVSGYLQVLLEGEVGELTAGQERVAAIAARNADRLERLVDDLIVVAQLQAGVAALLPTELTGLVEARVLRAVMGAEARGVRIGVGADGVNWVEADAPSVEQAVDYLIEHAIGFSAQGGSVEVLTCRSGPWVVIEVRDEGVPVGDDEVDALFAGRAGGGTGGARGLLGSRLGLYLVRVGAEAHGGWAEAECADDGGVQLRMVLPADDTSGKPGRLAG